MTKYLLVLLLVFYMYVCSTIKFSEDPFRMLQELCTVVQCGTVAVAIHHGARWHAQACLLFPPSVLLVLTAVEVALPFSRIVHGSVQS